MPSYPGLFAGEMRHTQTYRSAEEFRGKRVLIIGAGNSGADIACDAARTAARAFLSVRRGYHFVPKHIFGKPADVFAAETPSMPRWLQQRVFGHADCGVLATGAAQAVAAAASASLLVVRPCYVALRRALAAPLRPSGVVLVSEPGRALGRRDVEDVLGVPVRAEIDVEPAVARAVDAGLLSSRLPRSLERALRNAA